MNFTDCIRYISDINLRVFISKVVRSASYKNSSKLSWRINNWNERIVADYLRHEIMSNNHTFPMPQEKFNPAIPDKSIFIMWWQGEQNAPSLVKACIESVRINANGHKVIIITKENINDFINIPNFIIKKVREKNISFTHLSDIIRLNLLAQYGGAWIDATVFCAKEISEEYFQRPFYSIHFDQHTKDPSHGRWTTFLLFAQKANPIIEKALEYHYRYWFKHSILVDYIMFDYIINEVISQDHILTDMINNIPIEHKDVFQLIEHLENSNFNIKDFINEHNTTFYKLSWKHNFKDSQKVARQLIEAIR